jgi:hypothetical protein
MAEMVPILYSFSHVREGSVFDAFVKVNQSHGRLPRHTRVNSKVMSDFPQCGSHPALLAGAAMTAKVLRLSAEANMCGLAIRFRHPIQRLASPILDAARLHPQT